MFDKSVEELSGVPCADHLLMVRLRIIGNARIKHVGKISAVHGF